MAAQYLRLAVVKVTAIVATVTPEAGRAGLPTGSFRSTGAAPWRSPAWRTAHHVYRPPDRTAPVAVLPQSVQ